MCEDYKTYIMTMTNYGDGETIPFSAKSLFSFCERRKLPIEWKT